MQKYLNPLNQFKDNFIADSLIVTDASERNYLFDLVQFFGKISILLYRGSKDGWKYLDFHTRCDGKGATIVLYKTDKNKRCGGFNSVGWQSKGEMTTDNFAFLFSLDLRQQILVKKPH